MTNPAPLTLRDIHPDDKAQWHALWQGYLAFYHVTLDEEVTDQTWQRFFDPASRMRARVAVLGGRVIGFAIHHWHESSWAKGMDLYLEDLFVAEAARGQGAGQALITDLQAIGRARGFSRLYWHTDEGNATARRLYDTFVASDGHVRYRLNLQDRPS